MAALASLRFLHGAPTLSTHSPALPHHHPLPPRRFLSFQSTSLRPQSLLFLLPSLPLSPSRLHSSPSLAAASYASDEEKDVKFEEEEEEVEEDEYEEEGSYQSVALLKEGRRLYVGNLPYSMTEDEVFEVFGEAGAVEEIEVVYDRATQQSRGFAFVTMGSPEEAKEAIRMFDRSQVGGRTVKVNFPEVPRGGEREVLATRMRYSGFVDSRHKVYAGNLDWGVSSQGLRDAFASQPGLLGAKVVFDRDTGRSRGYGFVAFSSAAECQAAIQAMDGVEIQGRPLRLNLALEKPEAERPSTSYL